MSDKHITWLSNISKDDSNLVGGKAANLGELFNAKFPIPQGFIIHNEAFQFFLKENRIEYEIKNILKRINTDDKENLKEKSEEIQNLIANGEMPKEMKNEILEAYDNFNIDLTGLKDSPGALAILKSSREPVFVAIRASVPEELTGENKERRNFINIRNNKELIDKIKICFTSVFTPSSISFRRINGLDDFQTTSVIIQKMVNPDKSGIILTKTIEENNDNISIETIFGCGDVSKKIIPDRYELTRELGITKEEVSDKKLAIVRTSEGKTKFVNLQEEKSKQKVLKTYEIKQLADIAMKIENHFKVPQEIEFAIEDESLYITGTKRIKLEEKFDKITFLPIIKTNTKIKIISSSAEDSKLATKANCEGIGLIRIDKIIAKKRKHPLRYEEENELELYQNIIEEELRQRVDSFDEKQVWIRTSDIQSDKYGSLLETHGKPERNPSLGNHGIRFSLKHQNIFEKELLAIRNVNENNNIGIMLPQVISPSEIKKTKELLKKLNMENIKLGISIETPAAAILIKDICNEKINFVSINADKLTEYTLAAEEENDHIQEIFQETSWAILKLISRVVRECKSNNIETSVYGKITNKKQIIEFLVKQGIDSITVCLPSARKLSALIYKLENGEDYIENEKIGNKSQKGGESQMEEEKVLKTETIVEEMGESGETTEPIEDDVENEEEEPAETSKEIMEETSENESKEENEHLEENLINPAELSKEPIEQHNLEKENPNEEPISNDKPKTEDIFT